MSDGVSKVATSISLSAYDLVALFNTIQLRSHDSDPLQNTYECFLKFIHYACRTVEIDVEHGPKYLAPAILR